MINLFNKLSGKSKIIITIGLLSAAALASLVYLLVIYDPANYAAKVDGHEITYEQVQQYTDELEIFFKQANDDYDLAVLQRDVTQNLIDKYIITTYAQQNSIIVPDSAVQDYYRQRVKVYESEEKLLSKLNQLYGIDKQQYLSSITYDLLREAVQKQVGMPLGEWLIAQRSQLDIKTNY